MTSDNVNWLAGKECADGTPIESLACELCGDADLLHLRAHCHLTAPLRAELRNGDLRLYCYVPSCNRLVAVLSVGAAAAELERLRANNAHLQQRLADRRTMSENARLVAGQEVTRLRAELQRHKSIAADLSAVEFAAKVPPGYQHGLAAWITELVVRAEGSACPRTEDVEEIERLRAALTELRSELAECQAKVDEQKWNDY